jgi:hypothetical protein
VPLPPHAFFIFLHAIAVLHMIFTLENQWHRMHTCMRYQWNRMHRACGINDTACILHAVSMILHAF